MPALRRKKKTPESILVFWSQPPSPKKRKDQFKKRKRETIDWNKKKTGELSLIVIQMPDMGSTREGNSAVITDFS